VLSWVICALRLRPPASLQADQIIAAVTLDGDDLAMQLVARTGAQHQAAQQVEVAGSFVRAEHFGL